MKRGTASWKRFQKQNHPPADRSWMWLTDEMLESEAWRWLTAPAIRVLFRITLEHMHHGGTQNGELPCTFADFERARVDRHSIQGAIAVAAALGFIKVVEHGQKGYGVARRPTIFALTWLPKTDGSPATNAWKRIKSAEDAKKAVETAVSEGASSLRRSRRRASLAPSNDGVAGEIYKVVGQSPPKKPQQNGSFQWGKAHQISGVKPTHSGGVKPSGEKFLEAEDAAGERKNNRR